MCGIAGYVRQRGKEESATTILRMIRAQAHRGPDDEGISLIDAGSGRAVDLSTARTMGGVGISARAEDGAATVHDVALGHCRFSIIDLSTGGHQPFWSADRGVCVTFNGEIYNYVELRTELQRLGHPFRTQSDTEVLVEAYREWGTGCFGRFVGFWAVVLYDARRRAVLLSRDRLGKAPMYVARHDGRLLWASEINATLEVTGRNAFPIRKQAIADYAAHSLRDVGHRTFYEGIETFPNASFAWIASDGSFRPRRFWEIPQRRMREKEISIPEAVGEFRRRLADAVSVRLRADVSVGFELSGGLDSSTLVAAAGMQNRRLHAYTVSFPGTDADEEPYARQVHERYRDLVEYTVLRPHQEDFWEQADEYIATMGEPFHAPNMISNREIWRDMSSRGIRVSINGAAGDESWAGYFNDYYEPFLRRLARSGQWGHLLANCRLFGDRPHAVWSTTVLRRLAMAFAPANGTNLSGSYMTSSPGSKSFAVAERDIPLALGSWAKPHATCDIERRMLEFMGDWRMNHWLRVVNQSYMSVPTEVRCPFLDHRLVELAFSLPLTYLIRDGWLKWLVRTAMADHLPADVVWRKRKMGFPFPYVQWAVASRDRFFSCVGMLDCPYVNIARLREVYCRLARTNPLFLWRVMCLCLWWKRCVLGERLR